MLAQANELSRQVAIRGRVAQYRSTYLVSTDAAKPSFARVTSSLGTQESRQFRLPGAREPLDVGPDEDPRKHVMAWLRRSDNPFFAKAMVNRVWAHYFGRGLIDPPDDLSPLNPPTHPELLQELCAGFIRHQYDLRWLHRAILTSRTYQQSSAPGTADRANYARFLVRRLPAEMVVDAINQATGGEENYPANLHLPRGARAMEVPGPTTAGAEGRPASLQYAFTIFGRSPRRIESQCDCDSASTPSLLQGLYLAAYDDVLKKLADPGGRAARLAELKDPDRQIDEAYLGTLSRWPTDEERAACRRHLRESADARQGMQDLLWVLLNSREFLLIR